jgi:hypothetical protein
LKDLDRHAGQHDDQHQQRLQADQGKQLGQQGSQLGSAARRASGPCALAFAPDQFAGVEGGNDHHEQREGLADHSSTW